MKKGRDSNEGDESNQGTLYAYMEMSWQKSPYIIIYNTNIFKKPYIIKNSRENSYT
jgi:hypothetical protein